MLLEAFLISGQINGVKSALCLRVPRIKSYLEKCEEAQRLWEDSPSDFAGSTGNLCGADAVILDTSSALHPLVLALVTASPASVG